MSNHKESLAQRAEVLQKEIVELQKQFELKKEEFLKVQGAKEMLGIIKIESEKKEKAIYPEQVVDGTAD